MGWKGKANMTHEEFKEWIHLGLRDELGAEDRAALDAHLDGCAECRREADAAQRLSGAIRNAKPLEPDDELLADARRELRERLRLEKTKNTLAVRIQSILQVFVGPKFAIAAVAVAVLAIGFFAGSWFSSRYQEKYLQGGKTAMANPSAWQNPSPGAFDTGESVSERTAPRTNPAVTLNQGEAKIENVKILDNDPGTGQVEFTFDAVTSMHIKGSADDPHVQKVLTNALLNADNPGVRLRSVTAIAGQTDIQSTPADREVKSALIKALQGDENPAVRKEALRALKKFPIDNDIKKSFLTALKNDKNAGIRIAIINTLDSMKTGGARFDNDILEVLKDKMHTDDNNYIRLRAKEAVQEIHR